MEYPADFRHNISLFFGEKGEQWLRDLPSLLDETARNWNLTLGDPLLLSINYVAGALRADGTPVVLKVGVPNNELTSEIAALRAFAGVGSVRLLAADEAKGRLLLERLQPGSMLSEVTDDDQRTHITCDVLLRLWRPAPEGQPFIRLADWFAGLRGVRKAFGGGTGPFPRAQFERVEALVPELFREAESPWLLHGDCHHFNILSAGQEWLAIDPKGVIGPRVFECGPLLINPYPEHAYLPDAAQRTSRRIAILSERLGFSRQLIRDWGTCFAVLSSWWNTAPDGSGSEYSLACAELIEKAQI